MMRGCSSMSCMSESTASVASLLDLYGLAFDVDVDGEHDSFFGMGRTGDDQHPFIVRGWACRRLRCEA